ncbi:MAG: ParB/RepB/Spo0J family partition protein [Candidatus Pacebacteria bacterium]|nr:ParB/RepB/Spo0J family partition protein [Candidatus Paceibacterota bacterium]
MSRGLESLIPKKNNQVEEIVPSTKESVFWIETKKISQNPYQPRSLFKEDELKSLSESIKKYGVLQPLVVTKIGEDKYELIAGERRLRACEMASIDKVPVIIRDPSVSEKLELALIENIQRKNLNPMEQAEAFTRLREEFGLLEREIADMTGKSREGIANSVRLLNLTLLAKQALRNEEIFEGHGKVLLSLENKEDQDRFLKIIIDEKLTVRALEARIRDFKNPKKEVTAKDLAKIEEFENQFKKVFKYDNVKVKNNDKNYQVIINFKSGEEMEDWMKKL